MDENTWSAAKERHARAVADTIAAARAELQQAEASNPQESQSVRLTILLGAEVAAQWRAKRNAMRGKELLEFPLQNSITAALRQWAFQHGNGEFQSVWAGTRYRDMRSLPAARLMRLLNSEIKAALSE